MLNVRPVGPWPAIIIGAVLCAAGAVVWPDWDEPLWMLVLVAAVLVGIAFSFSWRGEALILIVAVGWVLIWSLSDRPDPTRPEDPNPNATERILALGDSYTSGEGSTMFFPGTNVTATNQCRRSSTAYPYLVAEQMQHGSGLLRVFGGTQTRHLRHGADAELTADVIGGRPQLDNPFDPSKVSVVLMSIGGNDAKFGKIGIACVLPGSCDVLRQNWLANVSHIGPDITEAFTQIREAVGEATPVVVVPYPLMISAQRCEGRRCRSASTSSSRSSLH